MKALALVLVGIVAASGCRHVFGPSLKGSGKMGTRTVAVGSGKTVGEFTQISSFGSFDIEVKQGPQSDIVITGDDNIISIVTLKVENGELHVKTSEGYSTSNPLKLTVTMPKVEKIAVIGSGNATVSDVNGSKLALDISGSGNIVASGTATEFLADISGSGNIDASEVSSEKATASVSGSGSIKLNASKALTANVSGSGDILYKGSPTLNKDVSGSGDVKPM